MNFYKIDNKYAFSFNEFSSLTPILENEVKNSKDILYFLSDMPSNQSRRKFCVSDSSLLNLKEESLNLLKNDSTNFDLPNWILNKINDKEVSFINTSYLNWKDAINFTHKKSNFKLNILALGDVGSTLLIGLKLLGMDTIDEIGIYDRSEDKMQRWEYEMNQVLIPFSDKKHPLVKKVSYDELFDCDMFIFCASKGVPPVGEEKQDVRMVQFESNKKIISEYAKMARDKKFKGIFAVVSDPVDLLSKAAFLASNTNEAGEIDMLGIPAENIRGYGLGVMNARANYYAVNKGIYPDYAKEGRAFGPHGNGLIIANSIFDYDADISKELTYKTQHANLEVRKTGFKPYIAPALSSGAISIIATLKGDWHYSATFIGGVFMGCKNRLNSSGVELERIDLPESLFKEIEKTYKYLGDII